MRAIVVVDEKWGIGKKNDLLFRLPADMKHFREQTDGKVVVMGSNTLLSFPGGKALKNRINIVLWPGGTKREDCIVVSSLNELFQQIHPYRQDEVYVVGGAMLYHTLLPYCESAIVTKVFADGGKETFTERHYFDSEKVCIQSSGVRFEECYGLDIPQEDFTILG